MTDEELLLLRYSEWLDARGIMKSPDESGDNRTHEELVRDFVSYGALLKAGAIEMAPW